VSDNLYSNYKYNRPKLRRRGALFLVTAVVLGVAIVVVCINMVAGKAQPQDVGIQLPALEFSAIGTRGLPSKSKALELAREIRERGGAGYVDFDGEWFVLEEIGVGDLKFHAAEIEIDVRPEHRETFDAIVKSFAQNTLALNSLLPKSAREAAAEALALYNELLAQITELDKLQGTSPNEMYLKVSIAANKQLLALFMIRGSENISSKIKHSICAVNFAYLELLNSFV